MERRMNWVRKKVHLYNVTMGLYMLDWWERYLINIVMLTLLWFICYSAPRHAKEFFDRLSLTHGSVKKLKRYFTSGAPCKGCALPPKHPCATRHPQLAIHFWSAEAFHLEDSNRHDRISSVEAQSKS